MYYTALLLNDKASSMELNIEEDIQEADREVVKCVKSSIKQLG